MSATVATRATYIAGILADWPALTHEQQAVISNNLHGYAGMRASASMPSAYDIEQRRREYKRAEALKAARTAADELTACDVCNLQPDAHRFQQARGNFHDWVPGRAEKIMNRKAAK